MTNRFLDTRNGTVDNSFVSLMRSDVHALFSIFAPRSRRIRGAYAVISPAVFEFCISTFVRVTMYRGVEYILYYPFIGG